MSDDNTFTLKKMFTLENLIANHRERFELRYSNDDDFKSLCTNKTADSVKAEIREWRFITMLDHHLADSTVCFLTGIKAQHTMTMTSSVVAYNANNRFVFTQTGSVYYLDGDQEDIPLSVPRIISIAATFNLWGVGQTLGMPAAFF